MNIPLYTYRSQGSIDSLNIIQNFYFFFLFLPETPSVLIHKGMIVSDCLVVHAPSTTDYFQSALVD